MILVTGASGFLGGELVKQLVSQGEQVRIIKRKHSDLSHLQDYQNKLEITEGDILDVPSLEIAFDGIDKIYHSAAVIGYDASCYDKMYKTNIEGTANVVNIALYKKVKKIVHISSVAAIGGKPDVDINEETKWEKNEWTTHYGITKMLAEREIWRGVQEGLDAVIANPGIIIGVGNDEHKATLRLFRQIATRRLPFYTPGSIGFIDVQDCARACIDLMESKKTAERYILVNETLTYQHYFEKIAKALQVTPPQMKLNQYSGKFFVFLDAMMSVFSSRKRGLTKENLKIAMENFHYKNDKFVNQFLFTYTPMDVTINNIAKHIKQ